jgi:hypothetical protein
MANRYDLALGRVPKNDSTTENNFFPPGIQVKFDMDSSGFSSGIYSPYIGNTSILVGENWLDLANQIRAIQSEPQNNAQYPLDPRLIPLTQLLPISIITDLQNTFRGCRDFIVQEWDPTLVWNFIFPPQSSRPSMLGLYWNTVSFVPILDNPFPNINHFHFLTSDSIRNFSMGLPQESLQNMVFVLFCRRPYLSADRIEQPPVFCPVLTSDFSIQRNDYHNITNVFLGYGQAMFPYSGVAGATGFQYGVRLSGTTGIPRGLSGATGIPRGVAGATGFYGQTGFSGSTGIPGVTGMPGIRYNLQGTGAFDLSGVTSFGMPPGTIIRSPGTVEANLSLIDTTTIRRPVWPSGILIRTQNRFSIKPLINQVFRFLEKIAPKSPPPNRYNLAKNSRPQPKPGKTVSS